MVMHEREKGRRLPEIDVLARGFLRRGLSEHLQAAKHVGNIDDIETMSAWNSSTSQRRWASIPQR
jgi:hypothetical protein